MKFSSRKGGASSAIVGIFIIAIVIIAILHAIVGLLLGAQNNNGFGLVNPWAPLAGNQTADQCAPSAIDYSISNQNSTITQELGDPVFWGLVQDSALRTAYNLPNDTVVGFIDNTQEMRNWTLQRMPDAPEWVKTGFGPFISAQLVALQAQALASGNPSQIEGFLEDQVSRASGVAYALVNLVTLNSAAALLKYSDTGNPVQAYCATFPSQLDEVWHEAFNPSLTEQERADYLGRAIAVSSVTIALAGADGFSPKFKTVLEKVGLADSWDTIKPLLGKIGGTVSARAAYLTLTLLEKLAQKFPEDRGWVTGLTSDRTASMAELLKKDGFSNSAIERRIADMNQAAGSASNEDDVAAASDAISLKDAGGISARVGADRSIYLYTDGSRTEPLKASSLQTAVPGFVSGQYSIMELRILKSGAVMYTSYRGGNSWLPSMPSALANPGDTLSLGVEVLTLDKFVKNLFPATLANEQGFSFMPNTVELSSFALKGDTIEIQASQDPVEGVSKFKVTGQIVQPLDMYNNDVYLQVAVNDYFGGTRLFKIHHDGYTPPWLGIQAGSGFPRVSLLTFDGVRLKAVYVLSQKDINIATVYMGEPTTLYALGDTMQKVPIDTGGAESAFMIQKVTFNRQLEQSMLGYDSDYIHGRLGAEIAYTVAKEKLGLSGVVLEEISKGGKDLYTTDGTAVIQARFLTQTKGLSTDDVNELLRAQLNDLVSKLRQDFQYNPATHGYAVLSYVDNDGVVKVLVVEVGRR